MKTNFNLFLLISILFCSSQTVFTQQKFTIRGVITDSTSNEELVGVNISVEGTASGTTSDDDGYFSLELTQGSYEISFSFIGYETIKKTFDLSKNIISNIKLSPVALESETITVTAEKPDHNIKSTEISIEKLDIEQIERVPVIMGETDIMKTIQLLPGITSISEGNSGYIVRGSGFDQNLILMDGMPIYYSSHMQGLHSVFNSDAVDGLTVYKGGTPARFGGRGASVLDVRMRESGFDQYRAGLSIGLITSKFSVEAPIVTDKLSVFASGRSTRLGLGYQYDQYNSGNSFGNTSGGKDGGQGGSSGDKSRNSDYTFFDPYEHPDRV